MSLRHGLLDLLAGEPRSGYDLARYFAASMNNVWPAQHSQIYPELARLAKEGLIAQVGEEGPRRRKTYRTTEAGVEELRRWLREEQPDYSAPQSRRTRAPSMKARRRAYSARSVATWARASSVGKTHKAKVRSRAG